MGLNVLLFPPDLSRSLTFVRHQNLKSAVVLRVEHEACFSVCSILWFMCENESAFSSPLGLHRSSTTVEQRRFCPSFLFC